ncbi:hypothetical protein SPBR_04399 [Sporothrix brasiliensis 5110]|uniref:Uncharacterized protein n=1 Tax=Sporothrix brasiliensis 5110 TaxID=1398154 RepID=A0A0C2FRX7_9PEZI|nr:uncharacterized protein SPBR_04399 [Sporothrix brasiliensis 5110]KIH93768.1 hypothetical protein SPBR_04399 [Sporothrix brasiliensis 5110]
MSRDNTFSPMEDESASRVTSLHTDRAFDAETRRRQNAARHLEVLKKEHETYAHCHEILVAADVDAEAQPVHVTLYDWTCLQPSPTSWPTSPEPTMSTPSPSATFLVKDPGSVLAAVKGYLDLGTIRLPVTATSIADLLVDEAQDHDYDFCDDEDTRRDSAAASSGKTPSLPDLLQRLRQRLARQRMAARGQLVQLWTFPVQTLTSDDLFADSAKKYVWHWYKPSSPYVQKGAWESQLDAVLENGSWMAGKDLTLVVRRVSQQLWQSLEDGYMPMDPFSSENGKV